MGSCLTEPLSASANTQNHLTGLSYDIAGNVLNDGGVNQPTYDAENRIATDAGVSYYYDADGVRMAKTSGTLYWPGPSGNLAETNLSGVINEEYIYFNGTRIARVDRPSGAVHYYFSNHLGSHSMVTSATGSCEQDIDYYPYGGVVTDHCPNVAQHYKFTGKERDTESGLDMFGARYYGSSLGRFITPDWAAKPVTVPYAHFGNPQSLNLYSYVQNNPTTVGDPDGHCSGADCAKITVTAEKSKEPDIESSREGMTSTTTVEGEVQYTVKNGGKPMADTPIHEDVSNKSTRDGHREPSTTETRDDKTNKQGVITDESTISVKTSAPSAPGTNAAEQSLTTGDFSKQTTQKLTIGSTGCQVTEQRTLSIKDGNASLTLQSPKTQAATPVTTPTPPQNPQNQ